MANGKIYIASNGKTTALTATPDVQKFIARLELMAADSAVPLDEMIALVYGVTNPVMDFDFIPGRAFVTAKVLANPAYAVMSDILFRKQLGFGTKSYQRNLQAIAGAHTLTVAQAAQRLGITRSAVAQAIDARRLSSWLVNGQWFIDPRSLTTFKVSPRGPAAKPPRASKVTKFQKVALRKLRA